MTEDVYKEVYPEPEESVSTQQEPDVEDCSSDVVPRRVEAAKGTRKIKLPELVSMWKYLLNSDLGNQRLELYSFLNQILRSGELSQIVGFRVLNRSINRESCDFTDVSFWKISRTDFYADVHVQLKLKTITGVREWQGYLVCWCSFEDVFSCTVDELTEALNRKNEGYELMSPFLVPYYTNRHTDEIAEDIWIKYGIPEALTDPSKRNAVELAKRMGLTIQYHPVFEHKNVDSILFFTETELIVGEDRVEKVDARTKRRIKTKVPKTVLIPANMIVVNTNRIKRDYSAFNIFHECIHFELHYMFFRLQEMGSNDPRQVKTIEVEVEDDKEPSDPIYFMEKQANRGAYGLMMPEGATREMVIEKCRMVEKYSNVGEKFEAVGIAMAKDLHLPHFRVKARMIQLGHIQAKGALNYVDRELIQPFAFDLDAWREEEITFVVDPFTLRGMEHKSEEFHRIMEGGQYLYADGHVVRNDSRYVYWDRDKEKYLLTDKGRSQINECCLRFIRVYVQKNVGQYVFGRMFLDADYIRQTSFYLEDYINRQQMDELDAKEEFIRDFPRAFAEAVKLLRKRKNLSYEKLADIMFMDNSTISRWMQDAKYYRNEDFLVALCLALDLPDWISRLVFKRAGVQLDEDDKRHRALLHILRVQSAEGIRAANEYLDRLNLAPLHYN